ncbi:DUF6417 family protein [Streptomyces sp. NPDC088785]|uniref:DUF6417 family protein n=1 Tax=Streptomyces sp. NPDC088785 TaxID=3365897 RepID=UPI0037FB605C
MGLSGGRIALLQRIADTGHEPDGWAGPGSGLDARSTGPLVRAGLVREASAAERAGLAARTGRPVPWAVRLTHDGRDVLLYARRRAAPPVGAPPEPGLQKVALHRCDLDVLERFVALDGELHDGPAKDLGLAVEAARFHPQSNRWIMYVDGAQMRSMARAFYLERHSGSAAPANRFTRVYGVNHQPRPLGLVPRVERDPAG